MKRMVLAAALVALALGTTRSPAAEMKRVAIASFGPHGSLSQVIDGFKQALAAKGFVDGKSISYEYSDCNFDPSLIPQVLSKLEATKPDLMLTVTTPMTQGAP